MPKYDGEVRIKYSVDKDGAEKDIENLNDDFRESASVADKASKGIKKAFDSSIIEPQFKSIRKTISSLNDQFLGFVDKFKLPSTKEMEASGEISHKTKVSREEYENTKKELEEIDETIRRLSERLNKANETKKKFLATGGKTDSMKYKSITYDIEMLQNEMQEAINKESVLEEKLSSIRPPYNIEFIKEKFKELRDSIVESVSNTKVGKAVSKLVGLFNGLGKVIKGIAGLFKKTTNTLSKGISKLTGHFQKNTSKMSQMFTNMGRRFLLNVLVFNVIRKAISSLISGLKEGVNNLVKQDAALNSSMSAMQSSIIQLRNALGSLASPIIQAVTPAIQTLCAWLTTAINKINQFISAITGKSTWKKATEVQSDYAASLDGTADAAKNANKQLSSLDELNVISSDKASAGSGSGSGTTEGGFTEEVIPEDVKSLAEQIKDTLKTDDWSSIGELIAEKFNGVLKNIPWSKVNSGAQHVAGGLATLINGFISKSDWSLVGQTIGNGINTAAGMSYKFLTTTDFYAIGNAIATTLNGAIKTTDFTLIGKTLAAKFNAQLHTIQGAVENFNFGKAGKKLGQAINGFIKDVDWKGIGSTISTSFIGALNFLSSAIQEVDWSELPNDIVDAIEAFDWSGAFESFTEFLGSVAGGAISATWSAIKRAATDLGKFVHEGFKDGVWNGFKNIGTWIKTHIFDPFINGFKKAFGIASHSKVMKEQGGYIIKGLLNGVSNISSITDVFTKLKNKIIDIFKKLPDGIKKPINTFLSGIQKMCNSVIDGINTLIKAMNKLSFEFPDWLPGGLGGKKFGLNIGTLSHVSIPKLAEGAVIQPNSPFLAQLGDQTRGVNIETPLDTMVKAFETALENKGYANDVNIKIIPDERNIFKVVVDQEREQYNRTGNPVFVH